ncbi:MAG: TM2 domain-containing protein [Prevotella sp.]|nr:TM2 domain-containing protein [Prevotella sp.]
MDSSVNILLANAAKYFPESSMPAIRQTLEQMDPQKASTLLAQDYKDPMIAIIISAIIGVYGIDRFYIGDVMMGVLKLITGGGCGIWWLIDIFLIMGAAKDKNYQKFVQSASYM